MFRWWVCCLIALFIFPLSVRADSDWLTQELVFADFESGTYQGWKLEGNCWGKGPVDASFLPGYIAGWKGRRYLCTSQPNGLATGKATSTSFFIPRRYLSFYIGGGNHPTTCYMQLVVNGKAVRTATGNNKSVLEPKRWNVQDLIGQEAHIEIVDDDRRSNGYLLVDHIAFTDGDDSPLSDRKMAADVREWLSSLNQSSPATPNNAQTRVWKMLVLFYPKTDTDYYTLKKEKKRFSGTLTPYQINLALNGLRKLPGILNAVSNGYCRLDLDVKVVDRAVTFSNNSNYIATGKNRLTHQTPVEPDTKPEVLLYNTPPIYDAQCILYNPGPVPQDLAGYGGGGPRGIDETITYGSDRDWDPRSAISRQLSVFVHEMSHGFDGFFGSKGYQFEPLHHLTIPRYADLGLRDTNLFVALHRGLLVHNGDARYGYSPAAWLSGTPRSPVALPPCQLLSPLPESVLPSSDVEVSWSPSPAPDGYEAHFCRADNPGVSLLTIPSRRTRLRLTAGQLPSGNYIWYVQACRKKERSLVADQFSLKIAEPATMGPIVVGQPRLSAFEVAGNGQMARVRASVTSPAGVTGVEVEYTHADGHRQRLLLKRRSFYQGDTVWIGAIWLPENRGDARYVSFVRIVATDHAGREGVSEPNYIAVAPAAKAAPASGAERTTANSPSRVMTPIPLRSPDATGITTLMAFPAMSLGSDTDGKIWAEITGEDGNTDYAPLLLKDGEADDWRGPSRRVKRGRLPFFGFEWIEMERRLRGAGRRRQYLSLRSSDSIYALAFRKIIFKPLSPEARSKGSHLFSCSQANRVHQGYPEMLSFK